MARPTIVWFRDDLRLADNPALRAAIDRGEPIIALYVLDEESPGIRPLGGAARWWLHHSLASLDERLRERGVDLPLGAAVAPVPEDGAGRGIRHQLPYDALGRAAAPDEGRAARSAGLSARRRSSRNHTIVGRAMDPSFRDRSFRCRALTAHPMSVAPAPSRGRGFPSSQGTRSPVSTGIPGFAKQWLSGACGKAHPACSRLRDPASSCVH